jgi:hypothetical protein
LREFFFKWFELLVEGHFAVALLLAAEFGGEPGDFPADALVGLAALDVVPDEFAGLWRQSAHSNASPGLTPDAAAALTARRARLLALAPKHHGMSDSIDISRFFCGGPEVCQQTFRNEWNGAISPRKITPHHGLAFARGVIGERIKMCGTLVVLVGEPNLVASDERGVEQLWVMCG